VFAVLAAAPGLPEGDTDTVLHLVVPLTPQGLIDSARFDQVAAYCRAKFVQNRTVVWEGALLRGDRGWAIRPGGIEEAPIWPIETRTLRPGEYVSLRDPRRGESSFRVVNLDPS
jgi:hypothetical protein